MTDPIILPPLPEPPAWMNDEGDVFARQETPEMELSLPTMLYTTNQLRARDLEVARLMLEAAAQAAGPEDSYQDRWFAAKADAVKRIRALEVRHHE